ncbi:MAG: hypothetical protein Q7R81_02945 [Candidatus Peregrinibacteria bacterium]|nr:hypothetical protein [Candidatus Peregrinibacteria bacterium]
MKALTNAGGDQSSGIEVLRQTMEHGRKILYQRLRYALGDGGMREKLSPEQRAQFVEMHGALKPIFQEANRTALATVKDQIQSIHEEYRRVMVGLEASGDLNAVAGPREQLSQKVRALLEMGKKLLSESDETEALPVPERNNLIRLNLSMENEDLDFASEYAFRFGDGVIQTAEWQQQRARELIERMNMLVEDIQKSFANQDLLSHTGAGSYPDEPRLRNAITFYGKMIAEAGFWLGNYVQYLASSEVFHRYLSENEIQALFRLQRLLKQEDIVSATTQYVAVRDSKQQYLFASFPKEPAAPVATQMTVPTAPANPQPKNPRKKRQ